MAGFSVKDIWYNAIARGNYTTWPSLTLSVARKYCSSAEETTFGTMSQSRKNKRSTKVQPESAAKQHNNISKHVRSKEIYIRI